METITSEHPTIPVPAGQAPDAAEPVEPRRSPLRAAIKTGRPQEWIKNTFVFAGLLFSRKFNQPHDVLEAFLTFVAFCWISSAGYYVNDLVDVELDRKHPKKRFRPLAAGELSERTAMTIAPALAAAAIVLSFAAVNWQVGLMVVGYIFRYLSLIYDRADDRSTAAIVAEDRPLIAGVAVFAIVAFALLYIFK